MSTTIQLLLLRYMICSRLYDYGADVSISSAFLSRSAIIPTTFPGEEHAVHASRVHTMADRHTSADHQAHTRQAVVQGAEWPTFEQTPTGGWLSSR